MEIETIYRDRYLAYQTIATIHHLKTDSVFSMMHDCEVLYDFRELAVNAFRTLARKENREWYKRSKHKGKNG